MENRAASLIAQITPDAAHLHLMYEAALDQIQKGLEMHKKDSKVWRQNESDFMMLDCCLQTLPTGRERGNFYAMDFGGTNLRCVRASLDGNGRVEVAQRATSLVGQAVSEGLPKGVLDPRASATLLFDTVALELKKLMEDCDDLHSSHIKAVGFTFSFGITQPSLNVAILNQWSKEFETGLDSDDPVIGRDVCELMNGALKRQKVPARVCCTLNDTTGTMIAGAIEKPTSLPDCLIGLILGTGLNACYVEPDAFLYGYQGYVINVEVGGFQQYLPSCIADAEVDFMSHNRGRQLCEKQVAALMLSETVRHMILHTFREMAPAMAWEYGTLPTSALAHIYSHPAGDTVAAARGLSEYWQWENLSEEELHLVKRLIDAAFERSAALVAVLVAALAKKTKRLQPALNGVTVAVDGSLYTKNEKYRNAIRKHLTTILGPVLSGLIGFRISTDGSGKGAACLAATLTFN